MNTIYMDNAATTPLRPEVREAMLPYLGMHYGNPSGIYQAAATAKRAVETARLQVAEALGADSGEIFFTSGGTEADNWALIGVAEAYAPAGGHIITSSVEHHAILHTCQYLEGRGYRITYLPVDEQGLLSAKAVEEAIRPDTFLISVMLANNEVGTLMPVQEIGALVRDRSILLHTDAIQAVGHIPVDVNRLGVDLLSLSAHKFNGPKGAGALYVRKGVRLNSMMHGGGQEQGRRAGTENVPAVVGLGVALRLATAELGGESHRLAALRDRLTHGLLQEITQARLNGHSTLRLPGNVNISFAPVDSEAILMVLDSHGIAASAGSACASGALEPSHVLRAMGLSAQRARSSIRFSLGLYSTRQDVDQVFHTLPPIIRRLGAMSQ